MAVQNSISASCTNKLCDYEGSVYYINNNLPTGKKVCPKCGFKTLSTMPIFKLDMEKWKKFIEESKGLCFEAGERPSIDEFMKD